MNIGSIAIGVYLLLLPTIIDNVEGYKISPPGNTTHQHITNESKEIWSLIPLEIKLHLGNPINSPLDGLGKADYDGNDDVIIGSGEEDRTKNTVKAIFGNHFWQPDDPDTVMLGDDDYADGLNTCPFPFNCDSSYRKALGIWQKRIIPNYLKGDIERAYYDLGRVAHLLEDAAQPSHTHLDPHGGHALTGGPSILEEHTGSVSVFSQFDGNSYVGQQYNYENLIDNFDWSQVQPTRTPDNLHPEFFRLFWYVAQKTQYWASDDSDGNRHYVDLDGNTIFWDCGDGLGEIDLWESESLRCSDMIIHEEQLNETSVEQEADAMIPHAMKAVAGLYRLFWDAVHIDWPTENHNFRRTGFTLLKGDLTERNKVTDKLNFFLDGREGSEQVVKPSIADIDGNGRMDQVILVHKTSNNEFTNMYGLETGRFSKTKPKKKFDPVQVMGGAIFFPPTLANIDDDKEKEIITGTRNGTVYVYDVSPSGDISEKWVYSLEERAAPGSGVEVVRFNGGSAVTDIDLDGDKEIIIADVFEGNDDWPGKVYVLDGSTGNLETSFTVNNGGAYASVSVANLDSDDNPEIVVPTQYGIKVLDYNSGSLSQKCQTTDGYIWGSAVIHDVDRDNKYEIVYVTSNTPCAVGRTCVNQLHVIEPENNCNEQSNFPVNFVTNIPRPTPTVANLDSDAQAEIVISLEESIPDGLGSIKAIDSVTGAEQWSYNAEGTLHPGFVSPNIADIDNDGNYNIILGENAGSTVYVLDNDGNETFRYEIIGFMDNGLAIADIDDDGMGEIVFKRAGSPETIFVGISAVNTPPELNPINNITAIVGDLIDLNVSGEIGATDLEADTIEFFYSSPFNESGVWQTTANDTGEYEILVEASDGNLSESRFIDVTIFNETTELVKTFADNSSQKQLDFTEAGSLTVTVRLPKNASVINTELQLRGTS